jgi:hypothetical protein
MTTASWRAGALAPAGIGLTLLVLTIQIRMDDSWADGVLLVVALIPAALLIYESMTAAAESPADRAGRTVLVVAGLTLTGYGIARFGQALSDDSYGDSGGTLTWMLALFTALTVWCHSRTRAVICVLIGALAGVSLLLATVHWVFQTDDFDVYRALLTFAFLILFGAGIAGEGRASTLLVAAAGVTVIAETYATGLLFLISPDGASGVGWGWELVMIVEGLALAVYAVQQLEPGPGYLGFFVLALFALSAGQGDSTLIGWPLALAIGTVLAAVWGVRETAAR